MFSSANGGIPAALKKCGNRILKLIIAGNLFECAGNVKTYFGNESR